ARSRHPGRSCERREINRLPSPSARNGRVSGHRLHKNSPSLSARRLNNARETSGTICPYPQDAADLARKGRRRGSVAGRCIAAVGAVYGAAREGGHIILLARPEEGGGTEDRKR